MNSTRLIIFFTATVGALAQATPEAKTTDTAHSLVVLLPRRIDYDVVRTSVIERVSQLNNHKYWQAAYVVGGVGLAGATWYYWPEEKKTSAASAPATPSEPAETTVTVVTEKPGGEKETKTTTTKKVKPSEENPSWYVEGWRWSLKSGMRSFVLAVATALIASGSKTLSRVFYWWKTPNKVALYSVLFVAAYNAFDGYMLRHKEGFLATNTEVIKRYNRALRALQQYIVELAAQTVFLAKRSDVSVDESVDLLLAQFSRDIDVANKKIVEATEPFVGEAAMCGALLNLALDSVGRLEDIYLGFLEDQNEETPQKHTQMPSALVTTGGSRRG